MKSAFVDQAPGFTVLYEGETTTDFLDRAISSVDCPDDRNALFVGDLGAVVRKHAQWREALPRVSPFYAVKCNDSPAVITTLAALGTGFDCASKNEMGLVLSAGVPPDRIIFANPCKQLSHIKYAANNGVSLITFDNSIELGKIARTFPLAKLVLRIIADDSTAVVRLSMKFGAGLKSCRGLIEQARRFHLDVVGVSFHVGSGCTDANTYTQAIADARCVFDMAEEFGYHLSVLDIGGGFPGCLNSKITFEEIASVVNTGLEHYFPADLGLRIIAEPGRFYVTSAFTLAVNVIAKRAVGVDGELADANGDEEPSFMYYLNDGVYSSFNCLLFDHAQVSPVVYKDVSDDEPVFTSSLWGPTCDGLDCVLNQCQLPELHVGDWLIFPDMGAYTLAAASTFNGFPRPPVHCIITHSDWLVMMDLCAAFSPVTNPFMGFGCGGEAGPKVILTPTSVEV
uniref:ornithine decarboxylase n=1 Tax=Eptatretus burgeri TaxID=7764 RepID=A0A8C4QUD8_EPTBU